MARFRVSALVLLIEVLVLARCRAQATVDDAYIAGLKRTTALRAELYNRIAMNDRKLCPGVDSKDFSPCFHDYAKKTKIQMQGEVGVLATAAVQSAVQDKAVGNEKGKLLLALIENMETVLEQVDAAKFFVNQYKSSSPAEADVVKQYRVLEADGLKQSVSQILAIVDGKISEASTIFGNANVKLTQLKKRRVALSSLAQVEKQIRDAL